jgi:hypothetical protein
MMAFRLLFLFAVGSAIGLTAAGVYWGLEMLLAGCSDHSRGLWEGGATVAVVDGGHALARYVLYYLGAQKSRS